MDVYTHIIMYRCMSVHVCTYVCMYVRMYVWPKEVSLLYTCTTLLLSSLLSQSLDIFEATRHMDSLSETKAVCSLVQELVRFKQQWRFSLTDQHDLVIVSQERGGGGGGSNGGWGGGRGRGGRRVEEEEVIGSGVWGGGGGQGRWYGLPLTCC